MPRYQISAEFSLATQIEPEGIRLDFDAEEFQDGSYWGTADATCDGGQVEFEIEAEDEDRATEMSEQFLYEGMEVEDNDSRTWIVESLSVEVTAVEWEPTPEEALAVLEEYAQENRDSGDEHVARVAIAAGVVIGDYRRLGQRVTVLETQVVETTGRLNDLSARLDALGHTPTA